MSREYPGYASNRAYNPNRRRASNTDLDVAAQLFQEALPLTDDQKILGQREDNELARNWNDFLHRPDSSVVMVISGNDVCGAAMSIPYAMMDPTGEKPPSVGAPSHTAYVYGVAIDELHRGEGYGFDIMAATLSHLRDLGYTHAIIDCKVDGMWPLMEAAYGNVEGAFAYAPGPSQVEWEEVGPQVRCELDLGVATT